MPLFNTRSRLRKERETVVKYGRVDNFERNELLLSSVFVSLHSQYRANEATGG